MQPLQMNEYIQESLKEAYFDVQFEVMEWNALTAYGRLTAASPEVSLRHTVKFGPRRPSSIAA